MNTQQRESLKTFTNEAWAEGETVTKIYKPSKLSLADPLTRLKREALSLTYYANRYADDLFTPALVSVDEGELKVVQQRIRGKSLQAKAAGGEQVQDLAGRLLRKIHTPVSRPATYLKEDFEQVVAKVQNYPYLEDLLQIGEVRWSDFDLDWNIVYKLGTVRLHGDYWLEHIIIREEDNHPFVVDWDHAHLGSPFRDFFTVQMWIIDCFGGEKEFWEGYGIRPDQQTMDQFVRLQCLHYLTTVTPAEFSQEKNDGLYHQMMGKLRSLSHT